MSAVPVLCRTAGGGGVRAGAAPDRRQGGLSTADPEPHHKAVLPQNVRPPSSAGHGKRGKTLALQIWNERLRLYWEMEKALCIAFCYPEPPGDGCRNMISLDSVTASSAHRCQPGRKVALGTAARAEGPRGRMQPGTTCRGILQSPQLRLTLGNKPKP